MVAKRKTSRTQKVRAGKRALQTEKDDRIAAIALQEIFEEDDKVLDTTDLGLSMEHFALKAGFDPLTGISNKPKTTKRKSTKRKTKRKRK